MPGETLERLELPLMVSHNTETFRTAYTITVDYSSGASCFIAHYSSAFLTFDDLLSNGLLTYVS